VSASAELQEIRARGSRRRRLLGKCSLPLLWALLAFSRAPAVASDVEPRVEESAPEGSAPAGSEGTDEHASEAPSVDPKKLALQFLNFGVLVFLLVRFGGRALNRALAARHHQLKADLAAAAELKAVAEAKLAKQEARLASLEQEIAQMRLGLKAEAEAEKARLIEAAEERARRIKTETAFLIEQQVRQAELRLRRESAEAALHAAEAILKRSIDVGDQQRLLDAFVGNVADGPGSTATPDGRN
jgi:F-type H+-transporting ATPase subunit b